MRLRVNVNSLAEEYARVLSVAENSTERGRDFSGRQRAGCDLVEERLKQMKIAPVDEGDIDQRALQSLGGVEAAEAASEDQYTVLWHLCN